MGVLFKEKAVLEKTKHRLKYTWNPAPVGTTSVDSPRWASDGNHIEEDAARLKQHKITQPSPSWAWPGGGQRIEGVDQWVTEMDSAVDEMFEMRHKEATDRPTSLGISSKATMSPRTATSTAASGDGDAKENVEDASLFERSRIGAGVVGLRRYVSVV